MSNPFGRQTLMSFLVGKSPAELHGDVAVFCLFQHRSRHVKSSLLTSTCRTDLRCDLSKPAMQPQASASTPSEVSVSQTHLDLLASISRFENQRSLAVLVIWAGVRWAVLCPVVHVEGVLSQTPLRSTENTDKHWGIVRFVGVGGSIQGTEAKQFRLSKLFSVFF